MNKSPVAITFEVLDMAATPMIYSAGGIMHLVFARNTACSKFMCT